MCATNQQRFVDQLRRLYCIQYRRGKPSNPPPATDVIGIRIAEAFSLLCPIPLPTAPPARS
ncbi:hypothetical protein GY45DRAFT_1332166 [Cubamyces sp. BRFM 1775]|nr:hypothetical protein GY45DRAFT_1332166 [Cubamyces sp. BRFM 1775]